MKNLISLICGFLFVQSLHSQGTATCRSVYDSPYNNSPFATHYFPGPMSIPLNTSVSGMIESGGDVDYYKFFITRGGTISLNLTGLPANYNLRLVNDLGNSIVTSARSGTSNETINFTATSNTSYFALVYPANNRTFNASACYTLRVNTGTAARSVEVFHETEILYPNPARDRVQLRLETQGQYQVRVFNAMGLVVRRHIVSGSPAVLDVSALKAGLYWVEVADDQGDVVHKQSWIKQ